MLLTRRHCAGYASIGAVVFMFLGVKLGHHHLIVGRAMVSCLCGLNAVNI